MSFVDEDELEGLKIKKCVSNSDEILLSFTDGSYTKIVIESEYYDDDRSLDFQEPTGYELVQLGVLDKLEYEKEEKRKANEARERQVAESLKYRRQQYETLRKEFEK